MKPNEIFETNKLCKLTVNSDFCHAQTHIQYKKKIKNKSRKSHKFKANNLKCNQTKNKCLALNVIEIDVKTSQYNHFTDTSIKQQQHRHFSFLR